MNSARLGLKRKERRRIYAFLLDKFLLFTYAQSFLVISLGAMGLFPKTCSKVAVCPAKLIAYPPKACFAGILVFLLNKMRLIGLVVNQEYKSISYLAVFSALIQANGTYPLGHVHSFA